MSSSLKEQLLKLGLGSVQRSEPKPRARDARPPRRSPTPSRNAGPPSARQLREIERELEARRARLRERVEAIKLDEPLAEIRHYYSTGKKIKRIYVTEAQQAALQRGEIVIIVVQGKGRLVASSLGPSLREIDPEARIIDPSTVAQNDADPAHQVPDDLRW